jgi:hypothetical protein
LIYGMKTYYPAILYRKCIFVTNDVIYKGTYIFFKKILRTSLQKPFRLMVGIHSNYVTYSDYHSVGFGVNEKRN